jgi:hypothetical protein
MVGHLIVVAIPSGSELGLSFHLSRYSNDPTQRVRRVR